MKKFKFFLLIVAGVILFSSCAHTIDVQPCVDAVGVQSNYGFWGGLWHGMIAPFTFIGHLFNKDVTVFAMNNNGSWYMFGFLLGVGAFSSTTTSVSTR
jgi:hypothetical protein